MTRILLAVFALALLASEVQPAAAGSLLVMTSTDPAVAPGTLVDDAAPITVAEGAEVSLLHEDGTIATITGPFSGPPPATEGEPSPNLVTALSSLVGEGGVDTSDFGSVRGAAGSADDPWTVDVSGSGHRCIMAGGKPTLWREGATTGTLGLLSGGGSAALAWPEEGGSQPWPATVPIEDYADYGFVPDGSGSAAHVVLHIVPAALPSTAHVAKWMAENGCRPQARKLLRNAIAGADSTPLAVTLDTPRGPAPVYAVGDELHLELALTADAYVECLYEAAASGTVRLFPNSYTGGPRLAGPFVHILPRADDRLVITTGGAGTETVRCFAWRADPTAALPADLKNADITEPLPRDLDAIAADIMASPMPPEAVATLLIEVRG